MSFSTTSRHVARLLAIAVWVFASAALPAGAAGDRLLFWETTTPNSTVYLLGSMHLATSDIYPLRDSIMRAYKRSDKLVVELNMTGANLVAIQQRMLERGTYAGDRSLRDELSPGTWQELSQRLESNGIPAEQMLSMKPGLVVTTLSMVEMMKLGLSPDEGIDRFFLVRARPKKPVVELETIDRQLDAVLDVPLPEMMVKQSLDQLDELESLMDQMVASWKRGDAAALGKLVIEDELAKHPEYRELHKRMFDDRNREMTDKILAMQSQGGIYFVVVGAGHLVGKEGIIALLERQGQLPRQL